MHSRLLLAILLASVATGSAFPAFAWSPLSKDSEKEVSSVEKSADLKKFHDIRAKIDAQEAREKEEEKRRKQAKQWWRLKKPKAVVEQAPAEEAATEAAAEEAAPEPAAEEAPTRPTTRARAAADVAAPLEEGMYEPGTAPAREITDDNERSEKSDKSDKTDLSAEMEANGEGDQEEEEASDDEGNKKKKKVVVPGEHPTEDVLDAGYFIKRSQSFCQKKDYQSALNYVDKAIELQPQNWDAWYQKALTYQLAGYDAAAARRLLKLISHRPDMLEARILMGMLYRKHNNLDLAVDEYKAAIDLKYYSFPAHYNLANVYMEQKKPELALKEYKICMKLQPNNAQVHNNMGVIFQQRKFLEEAADEFRKASHLDPANKMYIENLNNVRNQISTRAKKAVQM